MGFPPRPPRLPSPLAPPPLALPPLAPPPYLCPPVPRPTAAEKSSFREAALKRAFEILDGPRRTGVLPRARMEEVFREVNHYKALVNHIDSDRARVIFGALDVNRDGQIDEEEFMRFASLLIVRFARVRSRTGFAYWLFPDFFEHPTYKSFAACVRHRYFDMFIDFLLFCNAVLLIVEGEPPPPLPPSIPPPPLSMLRPSLREHVRARWAAPGPCCHRASARRPTRETPLTLSPFRLMTPHGRRVGHPCR